MTRTADAQAEMASRDPSQRRSATHIDDAEPLGRREPWRHGEQVSNELPALDVPEVRGRAPERGGAVEGERRIAVSSMRESVDLLARALKEREEDAPAARTTGI